MGGVFFCFFFGEDPFDGSIEILSRRIGAIVGWLIPVDDGCCVDSCEGVVPLPADNSDRPVVVAFGGFSFSAMSPNSSAKLVQFTAASFVVELLAFFKVDI